MENIVGIYKITNTITGDFYIGSSKNVKQRLAVHKCSSTWKNCPNNPLYKDMQKYGVDKFSFEILAEVEPEHLKEAEQQFIEKMHPIYNNRNAKGWDIERYKEYQKSEKFKEYQKEYYKSDKRKESLKKYQKSEKFKEYQKEYYKSDKGKESHRKSNNKYDSQLCCYNGETLTLGALRKRFERKGIPHPTLEAKKYLIER